MSKPTPQRLHKKELKRKKERKLMHLTGGRYTAFWSTHKLAKKIQVLRKIIRSRNGKQLTTEQVPVRTSPTRPQRVNKAKSKLHAGKV